MDIGHNNEKGLQAIINYLRHEPDFNKKAEKIRGMTFKSFMKNNSLEEADKFGFSYLDLLSERVTWDELRSKFGMEEIINFGVNFNVATQIGLQPKFYGGDAGFKILQNMGATSNDFKNIIMNLNDIKLTQWSPVTARKAGFEFEDLLNLGNVSEELKNAWDIKQIVFAYRPNDTQWVAAGFKNNTDNWEEKQYDQFVKTQVENVTMTRQNIKVDYKKKSEPDDYILKIDENKLNHVKF